MKKKKLTRLGISVAVLFMVVSLFVGGVSIVGAYDWEPDQPSRMPVRELPPLPSHDIVGSRTETTKTYAVEGRGNPVAVVAQGIQHWKFDYSDPNEDWKDIVLHWRGDYLGTAPYEAWRTGNTLTVRCRKTGHTGTMELLSASPKGIVEESGFVLLRYGVGYQHTIRNLSASFEARFRVSGDLDIIVRAWDDKGPIEVETTFVNGILTERIGTGVSIAGRNLLVKDAATGEKRQQRGTIRIDPVLVVLTATKDTSIEEANPTNTGYSANPFLTIENEEFVDHGGGITTGGSTRALFAFTLPPTPVDKIISYAGFKMYYFDYAGNDPGYLNRALVAYTLARTNWVEAETTWEAYTVALNWTTFGGDYDVSSIVDNAYIYDARYHEKEFGWQSFDVTDHALFADEWGVAIDLLVRFYPEDSQYPSTGYYRSREYTTDPDLVPMLWVVYTDPGASTQVLTFLEDYGFLTRFEKLMFLLGLMAVASIALFFACRTAWMVIGVNILILILGTTMNIVPLWFMIVIMMLLILVIYAKTSRGAIAKE